MSDKIPLIKVRQWLASWDRTEWTSHLPRPDDHFFIGAMKLSQLRALAGVSRRKPEDRATKLQPSGYQRGHDADRSTKIARYIRFGYPASTTTVKIIDENPDLIHPGWLPTAILVNIVKPGDKRVRGGKQEEVEVGFAAKIISSDGNYSLGLPSYGGAAVEPFEIIDGQHRVFSATELGSDAKDYEVPVVFFHGLTTSWQAYLFWVINVEPKKINPSLAFDLYPELRNQSWLERGEGLRIYQEHRSQELVEALWRYPASPWHKRIELLGNRVEGHVSNASYIRSLMSTFVRRWGKENKIGGLYGSLHRDSDERVLGWNRAQQAAFLVHFWTELANATKESTANWAQACRTGFKSVSVEKQKSKPDWLDPAFAGPHSLLGTDQGVRAVLYVLNALCQIRYTELGLEDWDFDGIESAASNEAMDEALKSLKGQRKITSYLQRLAREMTWNKFDWRTSKAPGLTATQSNIQGNYRGSSGYSALIRNLLNALSGSEHRDVSEPALEVLALIGDK